MEFYELMIDKKYFSKIDIYTFCFLINPKIGYLGCDILYLGVVQEMSGIPYILWLVNHLKSITAKHHKHLLL